MIRIPRLLRVVPLLVAVALGAAPVPAVAGPAVAASGAAPQAPAQPQAAAPDAASTMDTMDVVRLVARSQGKVVLLNFWASWCKPCQAEIPELNALRRAVGEDRLVILGLSVDEDPAAYARFVARTQFDYPVHLADESVPAFYKVGAIPRIVVYDPQGRKAVSYEGGVSAQTLENLVSTLLPEN
jgi:thiol-disulfide isomerase/thioredoxin